MAELKQPKRPASEVVRRLAALGTLHETWTAEHARPGTDPDLDASPAAEDEFHRQARTIMGLDPRTGLRPE